MTPAELLHARQLADAASPGPWRSCGASDNRCSCRLVWSLPLDLVVAQACAPEGGGGNEDGRAEDMVFVAASRHLVPDLLDEVERLEVRQQELLQTIRNLSQSVPFPEEAGQAGVLLAEVGSLKARIRELEGK